MTDKENKKGMISLWRSEPLSYLPMGISLFKRWRHTAKLWLNQARYVETIKGPFLTLLMNNPFHPVIITHFRISEIILRNNDAKLNIKPNTS